MKYQPLLVLVLALGACELDYVPDVGPLHAEVSDPVDAGLNVPGVGKCGDSDPTVAISFSTQIRPLTQRSPGGCMSCHGASQTSGFTLGSYEGLRRGGINTGTRIIVPGNPCDSLIVQKLGLAPPFGARMPYNGPPYFSAAELQLVRDWIAEGARNN